jgi:hypothetical protein
MRDLLPCCKELTVDDDLLSSKVLVNVAAIIWEESQGRSPVIGIDGASAGQHIPWDIISVARPEPDFDGFICSLHGIPTSTIAVERRAIRIGIYSSDTAASIEVNACVAVKRSSIAEKDRQASSAAEVITELTPSRRASWASCSLGGRTSLIYAE